MIPRATFNYRAKREMRRILQSASNSADNRIENSQLVVQRNVQRKVIENYRENREDTDNSDYNNLNFQSGSEDDAVERHVVVNQPNITISNAIENGSSDFNDSDPEIADNEDFQQSDSDEDDDDISLRSALVEWIHEFPTLPHVAVNGLLKALHSVYPCENLPKDARTLLATPRVRNVNIQDLSGGQYYHFGLENGLKDFLNKHSVDEEMQLQINIDGLPLHKSTGKQFWPILCKLFGKHDPFIIGLFLGLGKPTNHDWLNEFVNELKVLLDNDFIYNGRCYIIKIHSFICDSPARAQIKCVKAHNGYFGCERCEQEGEYFAAVMFPDTGCNSRTDERFKREIYYNHILAESPLKILNIGMVSQFVIDSMHLIYLGVVRKLLLYFLSGPLNVRMGPLSRIQLNGRLISMAAHIASDFTDRPRSTDFIKLWKATEFRQFVLVTGPVVLSSICADLNVYDNFIVLHVCTSLLVDPEFATSCTDLVDDLIESFIGGYRFLYGRRNCVYNVHNLSHVTEDVRKFGCTVEDISAFPFENHMQVLKRALRKPGNPLEQVVNRHAEGCLIKSHSTERKIGLKQPHTDGPCPIEYTTCIQYKKLNLCSTVFACDRRDSCVLIDGNVVIINNILQSSDGVIYIVYKKFRCATNFYEWPIDSSDIGVFLVQNLSDRLYVSPLSSVFCKYTLLPHRDKYVAVPVRHTKYNIKVA